MAVIVSFSLTTVFKGLGAICYGRNLYHFTRLKGFPICLFLKSSPLLQGLMVGISSHIIPLPTFS